MFTRFIAIFVPKAWVMAASAPATATFIQRAKCCNCCGDPMAVSGRWKTAGMRTGSFVDPFRPGLKYAARSGPEFDALTAQHLAATAAAFQQCGVLIFTLGLTEAWVSKEDGSVFPSCPGTIAGTFDPAKHAFCNFKTGEIIADLNRFIAELRAVNPKGAPDIDSFPGSACRHGFRQSRASRDNLQQIGFARGRRRSRPRQFRCDLFSRL